MSKKPELEKGTVTLTLNGDNIATFDFSDLGAGRCEIAYTKGGEELIGMMLEMCLDHIDFFAGEAEEDLENYSGTVH